jgi:hypothetical protein
VGASAEVENLCDECAFSEKMFARRPSISGGYVSPNDQTRSPALGKDEFGQTNLSHFAPLLEFNLEPGAFGSVEKGVFEATGAG